VENSGKAFQRCHVCGIDGLQHQSRSPARALGELVAHVYDLRLQGRAGKIAQNPTAKPCFQLIGCRPGGQRIFAEKLHHLPACRIQSSSTRGCGLTADSDDL
jgi:hypothetical protein